MTDRTAEALRFLHMLLDAGWQVEGFGGGASSPSRQQFRIDLVKPEEKP